MLNDKINQLSQYTIDGLREFSQDPLRYTSEAIPQAVKDNWDALVAFASGIVMIDGMKGLSMSGFNRQDLYQVGVGSIGAAVSWGIEFARQYLSTMKLALKSKESEEYTPITDEERARMYRTSRNGITLASGMFTGLLNENQTKLTNTGFATLAVLNLYLASLEDRKRREISESIESSKTTIEDALS